MRSSKSRSRGSKNRNRPSGGNIVNRVFDSSGPDGKVRGTPQQIIDKYNQLHRDAALSGDYVDAENYAQHAEHYTRMLAEAQREVEKQREEQERQNRERQAERDRERAERLKAQEQAAADPATMNQPAGGEGDSTLVETPEAGADRSEGKRQRAAGQDKPEKARKSEKSETAEQAEDAPAAKPRRSRSRKPKSDEKPADEGRSDGSDAGSDDGSAKQAAG